MSKRFLCFFLIFSFVGCQRVQQKKEETPTAGDLAVCVSESHGALIQAEADKFNSLYPEAKISVISTTTREAFVNLLNDSVRAIVTDRPLNAEERKVAGQAELQLREIKIAEDAFAVLVNKQNAIEGISALQLKDILTHKITDWAQIPESKWKGPILVALTGRNSGAYELISGHFYGLKEEIIPSLVLPSQNEVMQFVAAHPEAIGLVSLACYKHPTSKSEIPDTTPNIRPLYFAGVDSLGLPANFKLHQMNVYLGRYPMHYPIYYYFNMQRSKLAAGFGSFIASFPGQTIIQNWGLVPATLPVRLISTTSDQLGAHSQ
jgi:phosphate transport system substrate-binding protein